MGYIDFENKRHEDDGLQDRFLSRLYGSALGRMVIKIITVPIVSELGGGLLSHPFSKCAIKSFIKRNKIDMNEYIEKEYDSYNDFFMRSIKDGCRPFDKDENVLISPCDGRVSVYSISEDGIFNVKNAPYTVHTLLRDKKLAKKYEGGYCILIRLCVNDYHHFCYAADGRKSKNRRINGILHTVNPVASEYFPIYKENSREYTMLRTRELGDIIQMEVGALMVGKIVNLHEVAYVTKGQEKGHFEFGGSTVIILAEKDKVEIAGDYLKNTEDGYETLIKQGETIAVKKF